MAGVKKPMVCVDCLMRIEATIPQAQAHGWKVWVGGGRCKSCVEKQEIGTPAGDPNARICACGHTERWHRRGRCLGNMDHGPCPCGEFKASEESP